VITTTLNQQIETLQLKLKQSHDTEKSMNVFKEQELQVNQILEKDRENFYKQMDKIYRFYHEIINLNERIEPLVEEDINIKEIFTSILEWEKKMEPTNIHKISKRDKILIYAPLN